MARSRRFLLTLIACLAGIARFAGPVGAQGGNEEAGAASDSTLVATAATDTTTAAWSDTTMMSAARRAGERFNPNYTSNYEINRNTDKWTQTLNVGSWAGPVDLTNLTTIIIGRDRTLDRRSKNNTSTFNFGYTPMRDFRIASTLGVIRNSTVDAGRTNSNTSQDTDNFTLESSYIRPLAYGLTGNFRAEAGTSRDTRTDPLTSSRESTGPHAMGSATFTAKRWADWTFSTLVRDSRLSSVEASTNTETSDHNRQTDLTLTAAFQVPGFDSWKVSTGRHLNRLQYPFLLGNSAVQETNLNLARDFSVNVASTPMRKMGVTGTVNYRNNDINRVIDTERSQQSIDHGANAKLNYTFGDSTFTEMRGDWMVQRSLYDAVTRIFLNGDAVMRSMGATFRRPLGRRAGVDIGGNYQIQQFLFDDTVNNTDDRDILRGDASARLDYRPMRKVSTNLRATYQLNQTIFIDGSKSGNNQTQVVYAIYPTLDYQVTKLVKLREEASIVANATVFDFEENRNRLSRTTELRTTIDSQPLSHVGLNLRYVLRFVQDGSYRRGADGIRRFGRSSEDTSRDVGFGVNYTPFAGVSTYFRTTMRNSDVVTVQPRGGQIIEFESSSEFNELEVGSQINRTMSSGITLGIDVKRFQSWTDRGTHNNYWVGSVNVGKKF